MPYRIQEFVTGESYHIVSKAKDGLKAFWREKDYDVFLDMVAKYSVGKVRIDVFGFVRNHGHFLLKQICDIGIEKFMQILQSRYSTTKGFPGVLFRSPFWAEHIVDEDHYYNVLAYILRNPGKHKMVNLGKDGRSGVFIAQNLT